MMVTYEAMHMLFQAFIVFASAGCRCAAFAVGRGELWLPSTAIIALIVFLTNKKK